MKERIVLLSVVILLLAGLFVLSSRPVTAQDNPPPTSPTPAAPLETMGDSSRAIDAISPNALTSAYWMSNPYCYQPDPSRNECYLNIRYSQVTQDGTTSPYLYSLVMRVNGKVVYQSSVFFENSIYYSYDMIPNGIKVTCGTPNEGGQGADYGKVYPVVVEGFTAGGGSMGWGSTSVRCPAYVP